MASLKTKFSVGLFLIIGIAVIIIAIIWLGMSDYLEKGRLVVAYFDESVQGLEKDSPVKYRGVSIGRVDRISVAPDENLIEVVLKIESEIQPHKDTSNIVAQLKSVGITGLMFVELERLPAGEPVVKPELNFKPAYPVIPTVASDRSKLFKGIDDLIEALNKVELETISDKLVNNLAMMEKYLEKSHLDLLARDTHTLVQTANKAITDLNSAKLSSELEQTAQAFRTTAGDISGRVDQLQGTLAKVDSLVSQNSGKLENILEHLEQAAKRLDSTLEAAQAMINRTQNATDAAGIQFAATLSRIDTAARNLNMLIEKLSDQPSQLIFAQPPSDQ